MPGEWRKITLSTFLSWVMKLLLLGLFPYLVYTGGYLLAVATLIAVILSFIPNIVERNYRIHLPFELDLLITLALFLHTFMGEWLKLYDSVESYDKFLHFYSTAVVAMLGFMTVYSLHYAKKIRLTVPLIGFFTVIFALAMGGIWEIIEFWVDNVFGTQTQKGLDDTMWDLMYDFVGGVIIAIAGMIYVRYSGKKERKHLATPLGEIFRVKKT